MSAMNGPLTAIAEATGRSGSGGEESDEDEDDGGWRTANPNNEDEAARTAKQREEEQEGVIKAGYLWKKGARRKVGPISSPENVIMF